MITLKDLVKQSVYDKTMNQFARLDLNYIQRDIHLGTAEVYNYKNLKTMQACYLENTRFPRLLITKNIFKAFNNSKNEDIHEIKNIGEDDDENSVVPMQKELEKYRPNLNNLTINLTVNKEDIEGKNFSIYTHNNVTNYITPDIIYSDMYKEFELRITVFDYYNHLHAKIIYEKCVIIDYFSGGDAELKIFHLQTNGTIVSKIRKNEDLIGVRLNQFDSVHGVQNDNINAFFILYLKVV